MSFETVNPLMMLETGLTNKYCNLAAYLNLPEYFLESGKDIPLNYYNKLIKAIEVTTNKNKVISAKVQKNSLIRHLRFVLNTMDDFGPSVKEILFIYVYLLLDTRPVIDLILSHGPFKTCVTEKLTKIIEHGDYRDTRPEFYQYVLDNFTTGKRFFLIKKNREYRKKMCRIYMKTTTTCYKWYGDIIEKRYSPEGLGAIEAKSHFIELTHEIKNL